MWRYETTGPAFYGKLSTIDTPLHTVTATRRTDIDGISLRSRPLVGVVVHMNRWNGCERRRRRNENTITRFLTLPLPCGEERMVT